MVEVQAKHEKARPVKTRTRLARTRGNLGPGSWYVLDAKDKILGRLATEIARLLIGKYHRTYVPYWENGDHVVVVNAGQIRVSGSKEMGKLYQHYTGYPSGLRRYPFRDLMAKDPREVIRRAVRGMLPKNKLKFRMMKRLLVYVGAEHGHQAQKPMVWQGQGAGSGGSK